MSRNWTDVRPYFDRVALAHAATLMPDGGPHTVPVWVGTTDDGLEFFMETGSRKDRNLAADPRVAFSVTNPENPFDMAFVRGRAVERLEGEAAMEVADRLSRKYTGADYDNPIQSERVILQIAPERQRTQGL